MTNHISNIQITNFKSIKDCRLNDCKRINLFIGRPNVGKSNLIEALSLFTLPFMTGSVGARLHRLVRFEAGAELFHQGQNLNPFFIKTNFGVLSVTLEALERLDFSFQRMDSSEQDRFTSFLRLNNKALDYIGNFKIKRYAYHQRVKGAAGSGESLRPLWGVNLLTIILNHPALKAFVQNLFKEYGLAIAFDKGTQSIRIVEQRGEELFLLPYSSVADTLQRIIFYKAAILSNNDAVLLFEEPEAHSFPPYMVHITQEMINSKTNQFFVATHSPFIINEMLDGAIDELRIFNVDFVDKQTVVKPLSDEELIEVKRYGVDLLINNEAYL